IDAQLIDLLAGELNWYRVGHHKKLSVRVFEPRRSRYYECSWGFVKTKQKLIFCWASRRSRGQTVNRLWLAHEPCRPNPRSRFAMRPQKLVNRTTQFINRNCLPMPANYCSRRVLGG